jgi:hypothetical protein
MAEIHPCQWEYLRFILPKAEVVEGLEEQPEVQGGAVVGIQQIGGV